MDGTVRVAVYGKGGIGKSTVSSNLAFAISGMVSRTLLVGCDPKHDTTRPILHLPSQNTVSDYIHTTPPSSRRRDGIVSGGPRAIDCIEAGGPNPGIGCAGKGIITMFRVIEGLGISQSDYGAVVYDVLGDVVCGGFAVPMRESISDVVLIVTSGEYMSLYAANNIIRGLANFDSGRGRLAGLVLNRRGVADEDDIIDRFSSATGIPVVCRLSRSARIQEEWWAPSANYSLGPKTPLHSRVWHYGPKNSRPKGFASDLSH